MGNGQACLEDTEDPARMRAGDEWDEWGHGCFWKRKNVLKLSAPRLEE
jgi:hypothetical protein